MKLTPKHLHAIDLVADPLDTRTLEEKAADAGFTYKTLYRVLKEPEALRILRERTDYHINYQRPAAYRCLIQNFRGGDRASARDYLQAIGDIGTGGHTTNVSVKQDNTRRDEETFEEAIRRMSVTRWERAVPQEQE